MLSIILDPSVFQSNAAFAAEIERFIAWVKSSETVNAAGEILMPGEVEERTKASRLRDGIELDTNTWSEIVEAAASVGIALKD
jgi:hydroxycarboxylate dehydrogenase B